jgi:hypothetical protein
MRNTVLLNAIPGSKNMLKEIERRAGVAALRRAAAMYLRIASNAINAQQATSYTVTANDLNRMADAFTNED